MKNLVEDFYDPDLFDQEIGASDDAYTIVKYVKFVGEIPSSVVDIGAGTGRLAIRLLSAGHNVICIDRSERMLQALRAKTLKLEGAHERLAIHCEPFGKNVRYARQSCAVAPDDFLLHFLTTDELRDFFDNASSWLQPGAQLLTNIRTRDFLLESPIQPDMIVKTHGLQAFSGGYCQVYFSEELDHYSRVLTTHFDYRFTGSDGVLISEKHRILRQRIHLHEEILLSAKASKFYVVRHEQEGSVRVTPSHAQGWYTFEYRP